MSMASWIKRWAKKWVATTNTIRYRVELRAALECLSARKVPPGRLLDAGAGCGEMSVRLFLAGYATTLCGVEPDAENFAKLCETYRDVPGSTQVKGSIQAMSFPDSSFSIVLCTQVLEHVVEHEAAIRELVRVTQPGGFLVISVPFVPLGRAPQDCIHYDPVGHVRPGYTVGEMSDLLSSAGCDLLETRYFLIEKTCRRLSWMARLGPFRVLVPLAWVDAERRLTPSEREGAHPMAMLCLFRKSGMFPVGGRTVHA